MPCACSSVVAPTASVTAEINSDRITLARKNLERAGLDAELCVEDAADTQAESASGAWDIIFLDAERGEYVGYWPDLVRTLGPGGLLIPPASARVMTPPMSRDVVAVRPGTRLRIRKPAVVVPGWLTLRSRAVGIRRLVLDADPMSERDLVNGIATPAGSRLMLSRAHGKDGARCLSGSDDDVLRPRGAMHEVPPAQRALLPLDDQKRLAREHEEVFLVGLPVVHPHPLAPAEHEEVDPELIELGVVAERAAAPPALGLVPASLARVDDEPSTAGLNETAVGRFERCLGDHAAIISLSTR